MYPAFFQLFTSYIAIRHNFLTKVWERKRRRRRRRKRRREGEGGREEGGGKGGGGRPSEGFSVILLMRSRSFFISPATAMAATLWGWRWGLWGEGARGGRCGRRSFYNAYSIPIFWHLSSFSHSVLFQWFTSYSPATTVLSCDNILTCLRTLFTTAIPTWFWCLRNLFTTCYILVFYLCMCFQLLNITYLALCAAHCSPNM